MQQQAPDRRAMITQMLIIWVISTVLMYQFMGNRMAGPTNDQKSLIEQARQLDREGRTAGANVSMADRVKKLDQAGQKYEAFYNEHKNTPEGQQARFSQLNTLEYLANLEGKKAGTHWYDRAETVLKDMEKALHHKQGSVDVERAGVVKRETDDLGVIATRRLNEIRRARDVVNRDKITFKLLDAMVWLSGNRASYSYPLALALIVLVLKTLTFPFQKKQHRYMQDMMRIQPLLKEMQEKMKGRPQEEVQKRMMQIYKENDVNIAGGCLPMLVMMFALFPVFWMVRDYEYQFINGTFAWIGSDYSKQVWWLADNLAQFDVPFFVLYLATTMAYSLIQPKPADPAQAQQQRMMLIMTPAIFGFMMWSYQWSSAFMFYWTVLNFVSIYQSWLLIKRYPPNTGGPGQPVTVDGTAAPAAALQPMKGVHTRPGEKKKKKRPSTLPGGVQPRGIDPQA
jgi:YidC/Oxa1 family membrane protein insertase